MPISVVLLGTEPEGVDRINEVSSGHQTYTLRHAFMRRSLSFLLLGCLLSLDLGCVASVGAKQALRTTDEQIMDITYYCTYSGEMVAMFAEGRHEISRERVHAMVSGADEQHPVWTPRTHHLVDMAYDFPEVTPEALQAVVLRTCLQKELPGAAQKPASRRH